MHLKAKPSEPGTGTPDNEGWLYCLKKGQARTPKLPYFDWTGYISMCFSPFYFILICQIFKFDGSDAWNYLFYIWKFMYHGYGVR